MATKRLQKEHLALQKEPVPHIIARPNPKNILEFHFVIYGLTDCCYAGGQYHGKLVFPKDYPFKPPAIQMLTPNGRFETNKRLCLSMSDFHPESWNPVWSVGSILTGLLSFMLEDQITTGSIITTEEEKKKLALASASFNEATTLFVELFPEMLVKT
eukprot:TRINITY_DN765_c0_g1_i1.p1 TRINITY_DN765_c0_g1~~TRINITY_DN765_c0_g1_i1.p1  ORF type:complete len:178 (-),score=32.71 TRINITY_DN765_c0_g1_i1:60-530(-)